MTQSINPNDFNSLKDIVDYAKKLPEDARNMVYIVFEELFDGEIIETEAANKLVAIFEHFNLVQ